MIGGAAKTPLRRMNVLVEGDIYIVTGLDQAEIV